jgi:hypothetical protein
VLSHPKTARTWTLKKEKKRQAERRHHSWRHGPSPAVMTYYFYSPASVIFNAIKGLKKQAGFLFSVVSTAWFGGVGPTSSFLAARGEKA